MSLYEFVDELGRTIRSGRLRAVGGTVGDVPTQQADHSLSQSPGGGSQPGAFGSADLLFTEEATAGVYTATLDVEAGTVVFDVLVYLLAWPWGLDVNLDSLIVRIGDSIDAVGYYNDLSLLNFSPTEYNPAGGQISGQDFLTVGSAGAGGTYQPGSYGSNPNGNVGAGLGVRYAEPDTITARITTTVTAPPVTPAGLLLVKIIYFAPVTAVDAVFS